MLLKMLRSQKTIIGLLAAGVTYDFDLDDYDQKKVADRLLELDPPLAEETTKAKLKSAKLKAEAIDHTATGQQEKSQAEKIGQAVLSGIAANKKAEAISKKIKTEKDSEKLSKLEKQLELAVEAGKSAEAEYAAAGGV